MRLLLSRGARLALGVEVVGDGAQPGSDPTFKNARARGFREARMLADSLAPRLAESGAVVSPADIYGMERLEEALRAYLGSFLERVDRRVLQRTLGELDQRLGMDVVNRLLDAFEDEFLADRKRTPWFPEPAGDDSGGDDSPGPERRREELLGDLLVFSIVHSNPATAAINHAIHFGGLVADAHYEPLIEALSEILGEVPGLDAADGSLIGGLRRPIDSAPRSIADQLRWLIDNWSGLATELEPDLVAALDFVTEIETPRFAPGPPDPAAPGSDTPGVEHLIPGFDHLDGGEVHYAADKSWMSRVVLAAKNTHVWLHQLSQSHNREITRLDQIPDSELETLAERGITGLWLIGLWERSRASERIKQLCGNPEAAGSAYSLLAYRIADDLGGDEALESLAERARGFGIRLSADMVPNHTGIDSEWMIEQPDLFLSVPVCPFPSYTFDGPDLSSDPRVGIYLEDHYFDRSDAAVVFKRVDRETGSVRFVYHGNDGTGTAWNDTAQLDYLNPDTREAVTRTILEVARKFPIIRFDAAMTLARRHIQRLWHPEPGKAGAIPSRAAHVMTANQFKARMPGEFWREVVDRTEAEAPDTLLLAEAFWLMEGYFVRNLGLHRVYNSAFMNMLRDRDNRGYRRLIRESLEFDPEILRRYVNFLSNPDERTAIDQFGNDDRYFGACLLLATTPGLPMFAHGQFEGLTERYGMEYRRSYVDEAPDESLIDRHRRQITPLLRERERFSGVAGFALHDFVGPHGAIDENILAFSHGGSSRSPSEDGPADIAIVVFNNQDAPARGVLKLAVDLGIAGAAEGLCRFRDRMSGRYFLRASSAIHDHGLELDLAPYESLLLVNFRELAGDDGDVYLRLSRRLGLNGTPSFEQTAREIDLEEARQAFGQVLAALAVAAPVSAPAALALEEQLEELDGRLQRLFGEARSASADLPSWLEAVSRLAAVEQAVAWPRTERMLGALERLVLGAEKESDARLILPAFALLGYLHQRWGAKAVQALDPAGTAGTVLTRLGVDTERGLQLGALLGIAAGEGWLESASPPGRAEAVRLLGSAARGDAARRLGYDSGTGVMADTDLTRFLSWRATAATLGWLAGGDVPASTDESDAETRRIERAEAIVGWCDVLERLRRAVKTADFQLERVIARLQHGGTSRLESRSTADKSP